MTRWRAGVAVGWVAAALLLPAAPAGAFERPTVVITGPGNGQVLVSPTISGTAEMGNGLNSIVGVTIEVRPTGRGDVRVCHDCHNGLGKRATSFSYSPPLAFNGPYEATVTAEGKDVLNLLGAPNEKGRATRRFKVEAKPAAPRNVKAQVNPDRSVTITWSRNSEPDLLGYQVQRRSGGSGFTIVESIGQTGAGTTPSVTDRGPADAGGTFEYIVIAARPNGDGSDQNPVSSMSSPTAPVSVPGPDGRPPVGGSPGARGSASRGAPVSASLQVSSFLARAGGGGPPAVELPSVAVPDGGFSSTLPLEMPDGDMTAEGFEEDGELALDDEPVTEKRAVLIPIAAGLLLVVAAAHLRWLNKRMAETSAESDLRAWAEGDAEDTSPAVALAAAGPSLAPPVEADEVPPGRAERRRRRRRRAEPDEATPEEESAPDDEPFRPRGEERRPARRQAAPVEAAEEPSAEVLVSPPAAARRRGRGRRGRSAPAEEPGTAPPVVEAPAGGPQPEAAPAEASAPAAAEGRRIGRRARRAAESAETVAALRALAERSREDQVEADIEAAIEADAAIEAAANEAAAAEAAATRRARGRAFADERAAAA
ncbi:MAG TPA: hypothetical protein VHF24_00215, partial [Acidimicrobiales bacterium]|nr:hypothetical protein [Acidimicrobiales bacterium]